jgi:hypothetical protein
VTVCPFIEAEKVAERNVARACELLEVSRSAYYAQRDTTPSARQVEEEELTAAIVRLHDASKGVYGAPKIHDDLKDEGRRHGRKRVARIMREHGLRGKTPKRFKTTTIAGKVGLPVLVHLPKPHPQARVHFVAQRGLVDHSGVFFVMEQLGRVQGAPPAVGAPDLVQHQGVGVQLRVTGPAAAMVEHRRHQPGRVDLLHPVGPAPRQRRMGV